MVPIASRAISPLEAIVFADQAWQNPDSPVAISPVVDLTDRPSVACPTCGHVEAKELAWAR